MIFERIAYLYCEKNRAHIEPTLTSEPLTLNLSISKVK